MDRSNWRLTRSVWNGIIQRCRNPRCAAYKHYGGRGIDICEEWFNSFESMRNYLGPRRFDDETVDRIDVNGNYEPGNVRWATLKTQGNNTRKQYMKFDGYLQTGLIRS